MAFFSNNSISLTSDSGIGVFKDKLSDTWSRFPSLIIFDNFMQKAYQDSINEKQKIDARRTLYESDIGVREHNDVPRSKINIKKVKEYINDRVASISEFFLSNENLFLATNDYAPSSSSSGEDGVGGNDNIDGMLHSTILNEQFNGDIDKVNFIREIVSRTVKEGTCVYKIEWLTESILEEVDVSGIINEYGGRDDEDGEPEQNGMYAENERVLVDKPYIRFIEIEDFFFIRVIFVGDKLV